MGYYFSYPYDGEPFHQLGLAHILALLIIAIIILWVWRFPAFLSSRRWLRWALAGLLLANELFWHAWHAYHGLWTVRSLLPLNICNLMVLASAWVLLTKNQVGYEFVYLLGIPAASQVLVTPALGQFGFPHALFFQIFISHGGVVIAAVYLTLTEGMRPASWRSVGRVAAWTMLYALVIFFLNPLLNGNYLFLAHKPPAATVLDYLGPWPWYALSMVAIGFILVCLLYLPFHWQDKRLARQPGGA
jgi:hypothetical integral membrane protein (TIGR02206 family)